MALGAALAMVLVTSCIGTVSRETFDEEVRARGGGFSQEMVLDVIDDLRDRLGSRDLEVSTFSVMPASTMVVTEVRDPQAPGHLDSYVYRNGSLQSTEPVQLRASEDLDEITYPLAPFAFDRLDEMVDAALLAYDAEGGYVDGVRLMWRTTTDGGEVEPLILIDLESLRSTAVAEFTAAGELVGVELQ